MGSKGKVTKHLRDRKLWVLRKETMEANLMRTRVRPASPNPRDDVQDALRKFRRLPERSRLSSQFHLRFPDHPINLRLDLENAVPGVEVGDVFKSRAELSLVKLHPPIQAGIHSKNIISADGRSIETVAISIVMSGRYEDDVDEGETVFYTGEGGNELGNTGRKAEDQQWTKNNTALMYNALTGRPPVRLIRRQADNSFAYAGLYKVVGYIEEPGRSNFNVIKFELHRLHNQNIPSSSYT